MLVGALNTVMSVELFSASPLPGLKAPTSKSSLVTARPKHKTGNGKMDKPTPSYQWYPERILSSPRVQLMTMEEEGCYRRLLDYQWMVGQLPNPFSEGFSSNSTENRKRISAFLKGIHGNRLNRILKNLADCFDVTEDGEFWLNPQLEKIRQEAIALRKTRSQVGKLGGRPKQLVSNRFGFAKAKENPPTPTPTPIPTPKEKEHKKEQKKYDVAIGKASRTEAFERCWTSFVGSKQGKKQALKHFRSSVKTDADLEDVEKSLKNYAKHLKHNAWKAPMNGSTFFNNWRDFVEWQPWMMDKKNDNPKNGNNLTIPPLDRPTLRAGPHAHFCGWCEQDKEPHQWECTDENCAFPENCACLSFRLKVSKRKTLQDL